MNNIKGQCEQITFVFCEVQLRPLRTRLLRLKSPVISSFLVSRPPISRSQFVSSALASSSESAGFLRPPETIYSLEIFQIQKMLKTSQSGLKSFYDVVISGCGVSGAALAALLNSSPYFKNTSVLLLDKRIAPISDAYQKTANQKRSVPFSNRIYALNSNSVNVLKRVGAWEIICEEYRHWPAYKMQTLDSRSRSGFTTFHTSDPSVRQLSRNFSKLDRNCSVS